MNTPLRRSGKHFLSNPKDPLHREHGSGAVADGPPPASFTGCVRPHPRSWYRLNPNPTAFPSLGGTNALSRASPRFPHQRSIGALETRTVSGGGSRRFGSLRAAQFASLVRPVRCCSSRASKVVASCLPFVVTIDRLAPARGRVVLCRFRESIEESKFASRAVRTRSTGAARAEIAALRKPALAVRVGERGRKSPIVGPHPPLPVGFPRFLLPGSEPLPRHLPSYSLSRLRPDRVPRFRLTVRYSGLRDSSSTGTVLPSLLVRLESDRRICFSASPRSRDTEGQETGDGRRRRVIVHFARESASRLVSGVLHRFLPRRPLWLLVGESIDRPARPLQDLPENPQRRHGRCRGILFGEPEFSTFSSAPYFISRSSCSTPITTNRSLPKLSNQASTVLHFAPCT